MIGAPVPDTLLVIDIDPRNGGSIDALERWSVSYHPPSQPGPAGCDGGQHLYYLRPLGHRQAHGCQRHRSQGQRILHCSAEQDSHMTALNVPPREVIDGEVLLKEIHAAFGRYVVFASPEAHDAGVLWSAYSYGQPLKRMRPA